MAFRTAFIRIPGQPGRVCPPPKTVCCPDDDANRNKGKGDGKCGPCFKKRLVIIDFDDTMLDGNSDAAIQQLITPAELCKLKKETNHVKKMNCVYAILQKKKGKYTKECALNAVLSIPPLEGVKGLVRGMKRCGDCDIILISGGTRFFIEEWLRKHQIFCCFLKIFALPGEFDSKGLFKLKNYHDKPNCPLCAPYMCKGKIFRDFIKEQCKARVFYEHIFYVGDGCNDYCPIAKMQEQNFAFIRKCYSLDKALQCNKKLKIKCHVEKWTRITLALEKMLQIMRCDLDLSYVRHYFGKSSLLPQCKNVLSQYYRSWMCPCECSCCPCPKREKRKPKPPPDC